MTSRAKRPIRTLSIFLEALDGDIVDIELKNDVIIRGMMDGVDHFSKFVPPFVLSRQCMP